MAAHRSPRYNPLLFPRLIEFVRNNFLNLISRTVLLQTLLDNRITHSLRIPASFANRTLRHGSSQTKVAYHDLTILIDENVRWLYISVDHVARVQKFQATKSIIDYNFKVLLVKPTFGSQLDQVFHISFRCFHHNEDVLQVLRLNLAVRNQQIN